MLDGGPKTILIVDDDEDIVRILSLVLTNEGYRCATAGTGAQGAIQFELGEVDLIITDLNMPAGDGLALIERIRRESDVPIIVVTAFGKEYARERQRLRGVAVLDKPIHTASLLELIELELAAPKVV